MPDALDSFSPITREWFRTTFGEPTPPQAQGWLPIQRGEHTLILAPTGSGKTLAAFLWSIDELFRELDERPLTEDPSIVLRASSGRKTDQSGKKKRPSSVNRLPSDEGIHLLYVSPLKALNNDVERNLRVPLEGIRATAAKNQVHLPHIRVAVRTGDTPAKNRADMLKHPPHILITTPESLYLMLTSPRARELFRTTRTVIVDEIHTLAGNKRGVHLALTLERLQHIAQQRVQRIGLSATIKPLDEVARFLGGQAVTDDGRRTTDESSQPSTVHRPPSVAPRPVTIVDARYKKPLDLEIVTVVDDFRQPGGTDTVWPYIVPNVLNDIRQHTTTLVFTNNRRLAERTADRLNAQLEAEQTEEIEPGSPTALAPGGRMRDRGIFAIGAQGPIRAHHGSMSKEARHEMEQELKAGKLPALVGTSSLELGIDIGAIDLVVQLQSPKSVSQGLQRVGRSGHLVGQTSHGKIYTTFREDLAEAAAIARGMREGDVEPTHTPQNALDVLAQQIVACVAMQDWDAAELYRLVRGAYPYHTLSYDAFTSVLDMLTGKYFYEVPGARAVSALRAKIAWDRVNDRLSALPGSRLLALSNVGTIPDTGAYKVYLQDNKTKIGELDEEFVLETRPGDNFLLGSQVWRAMEIRQDRVIVANAAGSTPRMPFWNGDLPWRPYPLGERIGKFRREVAKKIGAQDSAATIDWLHREYALDEKSARNLLEYIQAQLHVFGAISSDRTIIVETFQNAVGDPHLVIHSPFGGRVNGAWSVALTSLLTERMGVMPEVLTNDDGIIFRFPQTEGDPPADIVKQLTADEARERILRDLPDSAVFGAHFRMNAGRALLLTKPAAGKRTPFWLQRLKAKDLLAFVRRYDDFPIVLETYRDVLSDVFDLPHLEQILNFIQAGEIEIVTHESVAPSPIAAGLMFNFVSTYLYEWDAPKAERRLQMLSVRREALEDVLQGIDLRELLKPAAIREVVTRAQHTAPGMQVRSAEELMLILRELGDLTTDELVRRSLAGADVWLQDLAEARRVQSVGIFSAQGLEKRWTTAELAPTYQTAFGIEQGSIFLEARTVAWRDILTRYLGTAGAVTRDEILQRYAFDEDWLDSELERMTTEREIVRGHFTTHQATEWIDTLLLEQIHRRTLNLLRGEVEPVSPYAYAEFLARWQHAHPETRWHGDDAVFSALNQLRGLALPGVAWERDVLPARVADYASGDLDALVTNGEWVWVSEGAEPKRMRVRFFPRGEGTLFLPPPSPETLGDEARAVLEFLKSEGASFATDIQNSTRLAADMLASALTELTLQGLVTNDQVEILRNLLQYGAVIRANLRDLPSAPQPLSSLETELDARRTGPRRISQTRYQEAKRRVAARIQVATQLAGSPWRGRWAPVQRAGILGAPLSEQERAEKIARVLLNRYGVITREVLEREELENRDALYPIWQRMEWRGEVRRGIFIAGVTGIQYALPEAVEQLRAIGGTNDVPYVLNATDPASPFGGEAGDLKFSRVPSTHVVLLRGQPILILQDSGECITTAGGIATAALRDGLGAFFERPNAPRHAIVTEWNGERVAGSSGEGLLKELGFYRIPNGMERWNKP